MRFPGYWSEERNEAGTLVAYGWSDISQQEADAMAKERFGRILAYFREGKRGARHDYHYLTGDIIREEVLERFEVAGEPLLVVSRNSYGAAVLNAKQVLFIDIDVQDYEPGVGGLLSGLRRLFTRAEPRDFFAEKLDEIRAWQRANSRYSLRVYRTHGGYRCVVLNQVFHDMTEARLILDSLGSDPLYIKLCEKQQCFRARLTPKPWRMGLQRFGFKFPYDDRYKAMMDEYLEDYNRAATKYAVCHEHEALGQAPVHDTVALVLGIHDDLCTTDKTLPLA